LTRIQSKQAQQGYGTMSNDHDTFVAATLCTYVPTVSQLDAARDCGTVL
jgi:hypothetical protein